MGGQHRGAMVTAGPQQAPSQQFRQREDSETGKRRVSGQEHKGQEDKKLKVGSGNCRLKGSGLAAGGRVIEKPDRSLLWGAGTLAGQVEGKVPGAMSMRLGY